ncbi:hypothetical protein EV421DRAFT_923599 [Armillaria borealis]|uniref:Uncharacterized protein n=1 Tax=Armillaria borealis TaxID=47425 RepID=A0AA39K3V3_9AGAR|nr:hypothetical protein EV421DRAFT_923599 [Armillaria borealis]
MAQKYLYPETTSAVKYNVFLLCEMSNIGLNRLWSSPRPDSRFLTEEPQSIHDIFIHSNVSIYPTADNIHPPWKRDLHALLEQPTSSAGEFLIHILMTFLIVTSAIVTVWKPSQRFVQYQHESGLALR